MRSVGRGTSIPSREKGVKKEQTVYGIKRVIGNWTFMLRGRFLARQNDANQNRTTWREHTSNGKMDETVNSDRTNVFE